MTIRLYKSRSRSDCTVFILMFLMLLSYFLIMVRISGVSADFSVKKIEVSGDHAKVYVVSDKAFSLIGYVIKSPYGKVLSPVIKLKWDEDPKGKTKEFYKEFSINVIDPLLDSNVRLADIPAGSYELIFMFKKFLDGSSKKVNYTVNINVKIKIDLMIYVVEKIIKSSFIMGMGPTPSRITGRLKIVCGGKAHRPTMDEISTFKGATRSITFIVGGVKEKIVSSQPTESCEMKTDGRFVLDWGKFPYSGFGERDIGEISTVIRDASRDFKIIKVDPAPSKPIVRDKNLKIFYVTVEYNLPKTPSSYSEGTLEFELLSPKLDPWELSGDVYERVHVKGSGRVTRKLTCWIEPGDYKYGVLYIVVALFRPYAPKYDVRINKTIVYRVIDQKKPSLKVYANLLTNKVSPGEKPTIEVLVKYKDKPVKGAHIWLVLHKSDGTSLRFPSKGYFCCTNENGKMIIKAFTIPKNIKSGEELSLEVIATYQPRRGNELLRVVKASTTLQLSTTPLWTLTFMEQVFKGEKLVLKPVKLNLSITGRVKLSVLTGNDGSISLLNIIRNNEGKIVNGAYTVRLSNLPKGDEEWKKKWGTINKYPMWSDKTLPGFQIVVTSDSSKPYGHAVRLRYLESILIQGRNGEIVRLGSKGLEITGNVILVLRSLNTWEQIVRNEVKRFLIASGVNSAVAQEISSKRIIYGVDCGMCGNSPCKGMYDLGTDTLYIHLPADKVFSSRGISVSEDSLGSILHEFGHRVKERLIPDPGAKLGGEHRSEYEPCATPQLAYDEAFADLFPILVQSYSRSLPTYVGLSYDNPSKVYGRHSSGKTGEFIEGRITGFWVSLYKLPYRARSGNGPKALADILHTMRVYRALTGRPPRTIVEWIMAKVFLDPTSITKIYDLTKPKKYNIPIFEISKKSKGVLRINKQNGISAFIIPQSIRVELTAPNRIKASGTARIDLKGGGVSSFCLAPGDKIFSSGWKYDGTIYLKLASEHTIDNMLKIDLYGQELTNIVRGLVSLGSDEKSLIVVNPCKVHIRKIGNGIPGLRIFTPAFEITKINSELIVEIFKNGTVAVTVLEGSVTVSSKGSTVNVKTGERIRGCKGMSLSKPVKVDTDSIEKWWPIYKGEGKHGEGSIDAITGILQMLINFIHSILDAIGRFLKSIIPKK